MQVVEIDAPLYIEHDDEVWVAVEGGTMLIGHVIELTEERTGGMARFDPNWHSAIRRFVSNWVPDDVSLLNKLRRGYPRLGK